MVVSTCTTKSRDPWCDRPTAQELSAAAAEILKFSTLERERERENATTRLNVSRLGTGVWTSSKNCY